MRGLRFLAWTGLALYSYLSYHLLVSPALLDYSLYGLLLLVLIAAVGLAAVPRSARRRVAVFFLCVPLITKALANLREARLDGWQYAAGVLAVYLVILGVGRVYAALRGTQLAALLIVTLAAHLLIPWEEARMLAHFIPSWRSPCLYSGQVFDHFPLAVEDVTGDARPEIITWGDPRVEVSARMGLGSTPGQSSSRDEGTLPPSSRLLQPEELEVLALSYSPAERAWGLLESDQFNQRKARQALPQDYPGFPYYARTSGGIQPLVGRQELEEGMLRFGEAPFLAAGLTGEALLRTLETTGGLLDFVSSSGSYRDIALYPGRVECRREGVIYSGDTQATRILGAMRLPGGREGLALLGRELTLLVPEQGGSLRTTHCLSEEQVPRVGVSDFLIADADGDGADELFISGSNAMILRPNPESAWEPVWVARPEDESFRFEHVAPPTDGTSPPVIVALPPSRVRDHPRRYVEGFQLDGDRLVSRWRALATLVNVRWADLDGDGRGELLGSFYRSHSVLVARPHGIPVSAILLLMTAGFLAGMCWWRLSRRTEESASVRWVWRPASLNGLLVASVVAMAVLAGWSLFGECIYPSSEASTCGVGPDAGVGTPADPSAPSLQELWPRAVDASQGQDRLWYTGWVASILRSRQINSMYSGIVLEPHGYVVDARVSGLPFRFIRWDGRTYFDDRGIWSEGVAPSRPLEPFAGFAQWASYLDRAGEGTLDQVLGLSAYRYTINMSLQEWLALAPDLPQWSRFDGWRRGVSPMTGDLPGEAMDWIARRGQVEVRLWIGRDEPLLYQYEIEFELPLPGAGTLRQAVFFRLYQYGDPGIRPVDVEEIQTYLDRSPL